MFLCFQLEISQVQDCTVLQQFCKAIRDNRNKVDSIFANQRCLKIRSHGKALNLNAFSIESDKYVSSYKYIANPMLSRRQTFKPLQTNDSIIKA